MTVNDLFHLFLFVKSNWFDYICQVYPTLQYLQQHMSHRYKSTDVNHDFIHTHKVCLKNTCVTLHTSQLVLCVKLEPSTQHIIIHRPLHAM